MHNKPRKYGRLNPSIKTCRATRPIKVNNDYVNHHPDYPGIWHTFNGNVYPNHVQYQIKLKDGKVFGSSESQVVTPSVTHQCFVVSNYPVVSSSSVFSVPFDEVASLCIDEVSGVVDHKLIPVVFIGDKGDLIAFKKKPKDITFSFTTVTSPEEEKLMGMWKSWLVKE